MKDWDIGLLTEFYQDLLSPKAAQTVRMYYDLDMSLKEIADELGITRQGVRDYINRSKETVLDYESKLKMAERFFRLRELVTECKSQLNGGASTGLINSKLDEILDCIDE